LNLGIGEPTLARLRMLAAEDTVVRGAEEMVDASEDLRDGESFWEYKAQYSMNLTLNL